MKEGDVDSLHDEIFYHKVDNFDDEIALTMHLYSPIREKRKFFVEPSTNLLEKNLWP